MMEKNVFATAGFTLIELSIVLVIIGLIVGGVLVGQDLIRAAAVRAQITQIEKYNSAVNTFRGKYDALPGDLNTQVATAFGFLPRGSGPGRGDGNGIIQGTDGTVACGVDSTAGESVVFWEDLTAAHLIDGSFSTASIDTPPASAISSDAINLYLPQAKIGNGNYVYVWEGGVQIECGGTGFSGSDSHNYYGLSAVTMVGDGGVNRELLFSKPALTVVQARNIDAKVDDGLPLSGNVTTMYLGYDTGWWGANWAGDGTRGAYPSNAAASPTSCFDNGGNSGNPMQYSVGQNGGAGVNCALSFRFQ